MLKKLTLLLMVAVLLLPLASIAAKPAPDAIDKVVFVHYPKGKGAPAKPTPTAPTDQDPTYRYNGVHWTVTSVTYAVNTAGAPADSGAAIQNSFNTWQAAPGEITLARLADTTLSSSSADGNNIIFWGDTSQYPSAIAVTFVYYYRGSKQIVDVDTIMNSSLPWSVNAGFAGDPNNNGGDPSAYDVENIMTHEAGHWLMLGDLYQGKAQMLTMHGYSDYGELQKRSLGLGDTLGIDRIY